MKKTMKRLSALLIGMMIALSSAMAVYADEGYTTMITGEIYSILRMHMKCLVYIQP
mgnify:CR=1 FL=1